MNHVILDRNKTGERLRKLIVSSSYTYDDIANVLNLQSSRVIYDWVNGFKFPKIDHLIVLSKILEVSIEDILVLNEDVF